MELTEEQYLSTFCAPMIDVTKTAEPVLDIWPFVYELILVNKIASHIYDDGIVRYVYRNSAGTFEHLLLLTQDPNVFIVIIIDLLNEKIFGYHHLDLNELYGLEDQ